MRTIAQFIGQACAELAKYSDTPRLDVEILLANSLKLQRYQLITQANRQLSGAEITRFNALLARRKKAEPIAYIIGYKEFMGHRFKVDERVLIPRPETELLVECVAKDYGGGAAHGLEIGVGSGAIAISLLLANPQLTLDASDISAAAIAVAGDNASALKVNQRLKLVQTDKYQGLTTAHYDFIVSNPPYIASAVIGGLAPNITAYEPQLALDGGIDGLDFYRAIIAKAGHYLKAQGALYLEIGHDQADTVLTMMNAAGFDKLAVIDDYAGHQRIVYGYKGE